MIALPSLGWLERIRQCCQLRVLCGFLGLVTATHCQAASNTTFIYQGRLSSSASAQTGSFDFRFVLWDAATGGSPIGPAKTNLAVAAVNGMFATPIDFGGAVFDGNPRWLELSVRASADLSFVPLSPRQPLAPTPYAIHAESAGRVTDGTVNAAALAAGAVEAGKLATGAVTSDKLAAGAAVKSLNGLKDDVNLAAGANITLGRSGNTLTIAAASGGGLSGVDSVVSGITPVVSGGTGNVATNNYAAVGGGQHNVASGIRSVIPGGYNNVASGIGSFAAGMNAQAVTDRTFVWAGNQTAVPFTSTAPDQFLVRAGGGIGLNTSSTPDGGLVVEGVVHINNNDLYLREGTDRNHGLGYYGGTRKFGTAAPDGPVLYGFSGGVLGAGSGGAHSVLEWTTNSVKVNGTLEANNSPGIAFVNRNETVSKSDSGGIDLIYIDVPVPSAGLLLIEYTASVTIKYHPDALDRREGCFFSIYDSDTQAVLKQSTVTAEGASTICLRGVLSVNSNGNRHYAVHVNNGSYCTTTVNEAIATASFFPRRLQ